MGMIAEPVQITLLCQTLKLAFIGGVDRTTCQECGHSFAVWGDVQHHYNLIAEELEALKPVHKAYQRAGRSATFIM